MGIGACHILEFLLGSKNSVLVRILLGVYFYKFSHSVLLFYNNIYINFIIYNINIINNIFFSVSIELVIKGDCKGENKKMHSHSFNFRPDWTEVKFHTHAINF